MSYVIGITGGVGAGKSQVLSLLKENFGAEVIAADEVGRELMEPGGACFLPVAELFGPAVIKADGTLDRQKIAGIIFQDKAMLEKQNAIIHPAVKAEIAERIKAQEENGGPIAVIEAALLFEGKLDELCDETWYIYAEHDVRIERLLASRPLTREKAENIMARQKPDRFFSDNCTYVFDNSGSFEDTVRSIEKYIAARNIKS